MEDYNKKVKEIVGALSQDEQKILMSVLKIESQHKQTMHKQLGDAIVQKIQKVIEGSIK